MFVTTVTFCLRFKWGRPSKLSAQSQATLEWRIPETAVSGAHRFKHFGASKSLFGSISAISQGHHSAFVVLWARLRQQKLLVACGCGISDLWLWACHRKILMQLYEMQRCICFVHVYLDFGSLLIVWFFTYFSFVTYQLVCSLLGWQSGLGLYPIGLMRLGFTKQCIKASNMGLAQVAGLITWFSFDSFFKEYKIRRHLLWQLFDPPVLH